MVYKRFSIGISVRVILITLCLFTGVWLYFRQNLLLAPAVITLIVLGLIVELIHYVNSVNQKLARFLDSIRFGDFSSSFTSDSKMGSSFKEVNFAFNEVMEVFKQTRAEKEEQMLFLQVIIQHINTGIISFNAEGKIGVINNAAKQLLQIPQFRNISDLGRLSPTLLQEVLEMKPGQRTSYKVSPSLFLIVQSTSLKMGGQSWTLLSLQNINAELQSNELEAWQNLTKVLRHEIMNSITPISSLVESLRTILDEDSFVQQEGMLIKKDGFQDIQEGLDTIANRSKGLVNFVNAYRDYTNIPEPKKEWIKAKTLIEDVLGLIKEELKSKEVFVKTEFRPEELEILCDPDQINMILINLIKNASESMLKQADRRVIIRAISQGDLGTIIQVEDNGPGIVPEALERIFVPFYTTKKTGSGIGLAISRQIMNLHRGSLTVESEPDVRTVFTLNFR
ncbi:MAG TPA: histidine kinase [Algoriphagus sp.]|jgi:nitrogen fixation/metabolism regulation signal transduction histidine kinase|uniref:sensor histidine kinase n=2 Tax=Algoriphagus TaxID=246875 RepID=UPI000C3C2154|nr:MULTISPECIES: ATP-binding protein [unclassified Algoriphagus]MAL15522.1 histidine kinase [Algoriphagus sp.]MAN88718.1 histidine kinase [Algoriphagus sp.]HAH38236.1 histidine kinase [Algoriphagus sp.]HAZ23743.1 histidine kinase [Algoriphagus sp.]HCB45476.1 histidine kinase [Algoriphagus sp.]|tara:strand:+ start:1548 stop:2900 length:1353 start_codon:yes stop_codon:yes gene_type:complete